ncbi:MAG: ATP-dependent Clp protease proteolytic subunit [Candidatus Yanofskybacteria bacterium]|nr:ATP-dependent Clp protease proteolytic subunit [Candidatus Yanofskybacteria bacterium]
MSKIRSRVAFSSKKRIIWFSGEIRAGTANKVISVLKKLNRTEGPICFYLSGPGGDFDHCYRIGKEIDNSPNPVAGIAHGELRSACFVLTQFFRVCVGVRGSTFGFHRAARETTRAIAKNLFLTQDDLQKEIDRLKFVDALIATIFFRRFQDFDSIFELLRIDKVLSLNEAIKLKLIDGRFDEYNFLADRRFILSRLRKKGKGGS